MLWRRGFGDIHWKTQSDHKIAPTIYLRAVAKLSNPQNEFHSGSVPARLVVKVCDALANEKVLFVQIDVIIGTSCSNQT